MTLYESLFMYAAENVIGRFNLAEEKKIRMTQQRADKLIDQLKAFGPEADALVEELREKWELADSIREQGIFLAGISIGITLGRLV